MVKTKKISVQRGIIKIKNKNNEKQTTIDEAGHALWSYCYVLLEIGIHFTGSIRKVWG